MPITGPEFVPLVLAELPELRGELENEFIRGLLHCEMGELARFAQQVKTQADWETYGRVIRLANRCLLEGDAALENAAAVSFLEHIDFEGPNGQRAWASLSDEQQRVWRDLNDGFGRPVPPWMK